MVCLGNICRSPLAEGILRHKIQEKGLDWSVDSAGTSNWHTGQGPDLRSVSIALEHAIDIRNQRARQFVTADFDHFDLILAMDTSNYQTILEKAQGPVDVRKVQFILNFIYPEENRSVPDPYYDNNFPGVFKMLDLACQKIIETYNSDEEKKG